MIEIKGRIIDENSSGIQGLHVLLYENNLSVEQADSVVETNSTGSFSFNVDPIAVFTFYKIQIYRGARVVIYEASSSVISPLGDWDLGNIAFHSQYMSGYLVRNKITGVALMVSDGNRIEYHIDNQRSWSALSAAITGARSQVHLQQFYFLIQKTIFDFASNNDPLNPPSETPTPGIRLEDLLIQVRDRNVDVKVIMRDVTFMGISITSTEFAVTLIIPFALNIALISALTDLEGIGIGDGEAFALWQAGLIGLGFILSPIVGPIFGIILLAKPELVDQVSTGDIVKDYFIPFENDKLKVKKFPCDFFNFLHAKYTLIDNETAFITASPFYDGYFSTQDHFIKDYRYGNSNVQIPVHDVSYKVEGNSIEFLRETYNRYWNKNGEVSAFTPPAPRSFSGPDTATVQVNRTIFKSEFPDMPEGEASILESYLRAINEATEYIYLENQYLIEEKIYDALVVKLQTSTVQLIAVVNNNMDVPGFNKLQRTRINRLKSALKGKESQFGFFTIWTHVKDGDRHEVMNNYVHSKVGIIDDNWVCLGSANLDKYSLRNTGGHEVNLTIFDGIEGKPASDLPKILRTKLWNEHLFGFDQDDDFAPEKPASGGWLALWKEKARQHLDSLKAQGPNVSSSRVLEWAGKEDAREYLMAIGMDNFNGNTIKVYDKIEKVFDFNEAKWVDN